MIPSLILKKGNTNNRNKTNVNSKLKKYINPQAISVVVKKETKLCKSAAVYK